MVNHRDFKTFEQETDGEPDELIEETPDKPEEGDTHPAVIKEFRYYLDSLRSRYYLREALVILGLVVLGYVLTCARSADGQTIPNGTIQMIADTLFNGGAMSEAFWHGEVWRPLTSGFLHASLWHIVGNGLSLFSLAFILRVFAPGRRWVWIFLFTQYFGCILASLFDGREMVGASVGIMGLLGALLAAMIRVKFFKANEQPPVTYITFGSLITLMGLQIVMESLIPNVGHMGHASGFLLGFIAGMFVALRGAVQVFIIGDHITVNSAGFSSRKPYPVESITFDVREGFDHNSECAYSVHKLHTCWGSHRAHFRVLVGSRSYMLKHRGRGKLVATRFTVPGWKKGVEFRQKLIAALEEANHHSTLPRLQRSAAYMLSWAPGGYAWYYMFSQWVDGMRMDPSHLAWVNHVLPSMTASYAIAALSVTGCAMMTFFFAQLVQQLSLGTATKIVVRILGNGRQEKPAAA